MKVADIMQKSIISVSEDTPIKEVGRMIFSLGIAGVPVVRGKKLVGIVTELDILAQMYPTLQELAEDYVHAHDFEQMEKNLKGIMNTPVKKIMNRKVTTISPQTLIMNAQSLMLVNRFSRLPIVDKEKNLIGIVSQGDIFRQLIKSEIPRLEKERYADFIAKYFDSMVNWEKRFKYEFPVLLKLFKKNKIHSILDLGSWTGEYSISLARERYKVLGLDHNPVMFKLGQDKKKNLPLKVQKNIDFKLTNFENFPKELGGKFDAAFCMGNALPYIPVKAEQLFRETSEALKDDGVFVLQVLNVEKILKKGNQLLDFRIDVVDHEKQHLFIEFFEQSKDHLFHHVIIFDFDGQNWIYKGLTSIEIHCYSEESIVDALKSAGFSKIYIGGNEGDHQGEYGKFSLTERYDPNKSDWLNVLAEK